MGDCRIRIHVESSLLANHALEGERSANEVDRKELVSTVDKVWSSDTTVREVVEQDNRILPLLSSHRARLWDCTIYPPRDITNLPLETYADKQGACSQTLYDAGWFPSGTLQVLPLGETPLLGSLEAHYDLQYNTRQEEPLSQNSSLLVKLTQPVGMSNGKSTLRPLPSKILDSVPHRFGNSETAINDDDAQLAQAIRLKNRHKKIENERARLERLQGRIRKLEQKSGGASTQVRRMLIKSRATGRSNVQMDDRLHFKCVIVRGDSEDICEEDYRYFSIQDTVGKVVSSFSLTAGSLQGELLVSRAETNGEESSIYRRLPALMRLYEAVEATYLSDFATIVIRFFDASVTEATTSIDISPTLEQATDDQQPRTRMPELQPVFDANQIQKTTDAPDQTSESYVIIEELAKALQEWDRTHTKAKTKKPASSATVKVRQMQMKARAKGDSKRVKQLDRFFVELVVTRLSQYGQESVISVTPVFVSKVDKIERIVRDCVPNPPSSSSWELVVPCQGVSGRFRTIEDTSVSLEVASQQKILECFGRVILRYKEF